MGAPNIDSAYLNLESLQSTFSLQLSQYKTAYASYLNEIAVNPNSALAAQYLETARIINAQLTSTHSQIVSALSNVNTSYQDSLSQMKANGSNLNNVYSRLDSEKNKIDSLLNEYNTLERVQTDTALKVNSNYMYYRLFFIIALIIIVLIVKQLINYSSTGATTSGMQGGGKLGKLAKYNMLFNFVIIVLSLFLANTIQHYSAYTLWACIVLAFVFYKMKAFRKFK